MWTFNKHLKLVFYTSTLFGWLSVNLSATRVTEQTAASVIKFVEQADENWIADLQNYIIHNIYKPKNVSDNGTLTKQVAHCRLSCNNNVDNVDIYFDDQCKTQPVWIYDRQVTSELLNDMPYAEATIPCFLKLASSKIPNAGRGIFTTKYKLPKGLLFGPYEGEIRSVYEEEGDNPKNKGYSWTINVYDKENADFYIDGISDSNSNWLRYINTARYEEEQNVFPLLFNKTVYYYVYKDIEPDTELLIWYGYKYAKWLNISVTPNSTHDWTTDYAPPLADTICPTCPVTEGDTRKEEENEEEEEEDDEEEQTCRGEPIYGDIIIEDPDFVPDLRRMDGTPIDDGDDTNDYEQDSDVKEQDNVVAENDNKAAESEPNESQSASSIPSNLRTEL